MNAMPASTMPATPVDRRYGSGAELLLRIAVIAVEGKVDGIGTSELRRLLGHPRDQLDRMDDDTFAEMVDDHGPFLGTALIIARHPDKARKHVTRLREAVEQARIDAVLPATFAITMKDTR